MAINNLEIPVIPLFVFGTLRTDARLDYYMHGAKRIGDYYTQGQLMMSEIGSAYIDFSDKKAATIGELFWVDYACLQRINHLESTSGEFPKGYDLDLIPVWPQSEMDTMNFPAKTRQMSLFYSRRNNPRKIKSGDWLKVKQPLHELRNFLHENQYNTLSSIDVVDFLADYLKR